MTNTVDRFFKSAWPLVPVVGAFVLLAVVLAGWKSFDLTYQAWDLWWEGETPISAFTKGHPHSMRYVLYYPLFLAAEGAGVPVDLIFGFACVGLYVLIIWAMAGIEGSLVRPQSWRVAAYACVFFGLTLLMNGRLLIAFGGYALVILSFTSAARSGWAINNSAILSLGALLTSVSSGTLAVAATFSAMAFLYVTIRKPGLSGRVLLVGSIVLLGALFASTLWIGFFKNVDYFGGGIQGFIGMLDHGLGRIFLKFGNVGIAAVGATAVAGTIVAYLLGRLIDAKCHLVALAVLPASLGGLFGISTMVVALVPILLLLRHDLIPFSANRSATVQLDD